MGLVPTKLRIFQLRRKFLRFVCTRPAREGAAFAVPFEPPGVSCSQPVSADDSAELSIRNGARRTPLTGCRMEARLPPLHALAVAPHGHRLACIVGGIAARIGHGERSVLGGRLARFGNLRRCLFGQVVAQEARGPAHVGDVHVAQPGVLFEHHTTDLLVILLAPRLGLLDGLVDVRVTLLSCHIGYLL